MLINKSYKKFNDWCASKADTTTPENIKLSELCDKNSDYARIMSILQNGKTKLNGKSKVNLELDRSPRDAVLPDNLEFSISAEDDSELAEIFNLNASNLPTNPYSLRLRNIKIWRCTLSNPLENAGLVVIENCEIATLRLEHGAKVVLKNSKVGTLSIQKVSLIDMDGGCILNIDIPAPGGANPLTGSIDFVGTFFPRNRKDYLLTGPQPYRNMRHHLGNIENGQMANLFHSAELAVERERDTKMNKFLSYAYELFSDFGSSATRTVVWWFAMGFVVTAILYFTNGATPVFVDEYYSGWRVTLAIGGENYVANVVKAMYLSFSTMLNPLGLFGHRSLLVPANGWLFLLLLVQGLVSAGLIALLILAIRRRFKMQ